MLTQLHYQLPVVYVVQYWC